MCHYHSPMKLVDLIFLFMQVYSRLWYEYIYKQNHVPICTINSCMSVVCFSDLCVAATSSISSMVCVVWAVRRSHEQHGAIAFTLMPEMSQPTVLLV